MVDIINLHNMRQTFDFDCGAQALQTVMVYYGVEVRADELIIDLKADKDGVSTESMVSVARERGFNVMAGPHWTINAIKKYVDQGNPVIVLLQAWAERNKTLHDWRTDYDDGHYAIVIGHTNNLLIFEDPSSFRRTWLKEHELLARWHDMDPRTGRIIKHFGMVLLGRQPVTQSIEHMD